jgi:peptidoglycan/LPS O-acetylase OafA/YrhL
MSADSDQYAPPYSRLQKDAVRKPIVPASHSSANERLLVVVDSLPVGVLRKTAIQGCVRGTALNSNLDILRSVAVLAVFAAHALQMIAGRKPGEYFAYGVDTYSLGQIGVLIFFVHTSLVLMQSLKRTATNLFGWSLIEHFYIRRAFRIYPLSFCLILLSIAFSIPPNALGGPYTWRGVKWALANVLLIQNIAGVSPVASPLWSLPYEVQMYIILPLLFLALRAQKGSAGLVLIYCDGLLLTLFHPLFRYLPCFLAGVIAYKLLETVRPRFRAWLWCPAIIGAVVLYVSTQYCYAGSLKDVLICLIVGVLIPLFQQNCGAIATIASHIAKYSYGIYLCHTPVLWLLYRKLTIPDWQRPVWLLIVTGIVSLACYHAIEHPLIEIGTRLANRVSAKPRASALVQDRAVETASLKHDGLTQAGKASTAMRHSANQDQQT